MKVKDLKRILENIDNNLEVIVSSDAEGNGFNFLTKNYQLLYFDFTEGEFNLYSPDDPEEAAFINKKSKKCILIWTE